MISRHPIKVRIDLEIPHKLFNKLQSFGERIERLPVTLVRRLNATLARHVIQIEAPSVSVTPSIKAVISFGIIGSALIGHWCVPSVDVLLIPYYHFQSSIIMLVMRDIASKTFLDYNFWLD